MNENAGVTLATNNIKAIDVGTDRSLKSVLDENVDEHNGALSPDGKWMVYQSNESSGRYEIYVRPYPDVQSGRWQISSGGGIKPVWRGQEIFYLGPQNTMMVVPVKTDKGFAPGKPVKLFPGQYVAALNGRTYDVTADGQKFLMIKAIGQGPLGTTPIRIVIVQNWLEHAGDSNPNP